MAQALFCFIGPAGLDGTLPCLQDVLPVLRTRTLHPSIPLNLLGAQAGIVTPTLIIKIDIAVWSPGPDQLGNGIDEGTDFSFGSLARGDIGSDIDEVLDMVIHVLMGCDRCLK